LRLKKLHIITQYKNLTNFKLNFEGDSFIDIFVGKNGTGKSNLFEVIIKIFQHLYEYDKAKDDISFDYKIEYELDGATVTVEWKSNQLFINGEERKSVNKKVLPDNVLIYYSGHNETVSNLVNTYQEKFSKRIKKADFDESRSFIGIGSEYKGLLLAIMLLQEESSKARQFICQKLEIKPDISSVKLVLKRPVFANKKLQIDDFDPKTHFWGTSGITKEFLEKLILCIKGEFKHSDIYNNANNTYSFEVNTELYHSVIGNNTAVTEQFRLFDNLKTLGMLDKITTSVTLENGIEANIDQFSDGQFQSIYIYSIMELFKDRNCISLLDEPDAFLHPEWQFEFLKQVFEITDVEAVNNHVLISSHSASTIMSIKESLLNVFEISGNKVVHKKLSKSEVIKSLSSGLISFSESEARLNINNVLNNTSGAVLFTEGITDEMILETAWSKLYPDKKPEFEIQNAFSCGFLRNLVKNKEIYQNFPDRTFFALFDFDEAFSDWNQLGNNIQEDPHKCLAKKLKKYKSYAILLPVPITGAIKDQVINPSTGSNYGNRSLLTIEHLFYGIPGLDSFFTVDVNRTDNFIKFKTDSKKVRFAEKIVTTLDAIHFEGFRPIFEFIKSKCN